MQHHLVQFLSFTPHKYLDELISCWQARHNHRIVLCSKSGLQHATCYLLVRWCYLEHQCVLYKYVNP